MAGSTLLSLSSRPPSCSPLSNRVNTFLFCCACQHTSDLLATSASRVLVLEPFRSLSYFSSIWARNMPTRVSLDFFPFPLGCNPRSAHLDPRHPPPPWVSSSTALPARFSLLTPQRAAGQSVHLGGVPTGDPLGLGAQEPGYYKWTFELPLEIGNIYSWQQTEQAVKILLVSGGSGVAVCFSIFTGSASGWGLCNGKTRLAWRCPRVAGGTHSHVSWEHQSCCLVAAP